MASRLALQAQAAAQRLTNHYKRQRPPSARRSKSPVPPYRRPPFGASRPLWYCSGQAI
jgi:hypothetical protein